MAIPGALCHGRFQLLRELGAGGMGVVHEAIDREHGGRVAIKQLQLLTPQSLHRFKLEFRALQEVRHPNLVSLGELFQDDGGWFFTMELVDGDDWLRYVRPRPDAGDHEAELGDFCVDDPTLVPPPGIAPAALDERRLRHALGQLAHALISLHGAGKVHRDIKPSNIRLTREGRLVLLDFGLIGDVAPRGDSEVQIVGTVEYMAPEQAGATPVGPAADWYAVGVLLYETLTGELPFAGPSIKVLLDKQLHEPPTPPPVTSSAADLSALCARLLRFDPATRATARDVLAVTGEPGDEEVGSPSFASPGHRTPFVGRSRELEQLREIRGAAATVAIRGESGIGKTSLVRRFVELRRVDEPATVALAGRCHERESVPYKAFDDAIADLLRHLRRLDEVEVAILLGDDTPLAARLFPALARLGAVRRATPGYREVANPHEQRTRAFAVIRRALTRLAHRGPLILWIDDVQWIDPDSLALLQELLRAPDAPEMLTILTARAGEAHADAALASLSPVAELALDGLCADDGADLVRLLARGLDAPSLDPDELWREAGGHPMFLRELVHHAIVHGVHGQPGEASAHLEDVLGERLLRLDAPARALLDVLAVAGAPLPVRIAIAAAGLEPAAAVRHLGVLRVAALVRTTTSKGREAIEPYHDRVRGAVMAQVVDPRPVHARLAEAIESALPELQDAPLLVRHLEAAGAPESAARHAERAAALAAEALAFDQAAELYRTALRLGSGERERERRVLTRLAESLVNAGRALEAADVHERLADGVGGVARIEHLRQSAEQLLVSGHVERGLDRIRTVFAEVGLRFPDTPRQVLATVARHRLLLRLRGLRWTERDPSTTTARELEELEFHKAVCLGLSMIDSARAAAFSASGLRVAFRTGQRQHVARFLCVEATLIASRGAGAAARAETLLAEVRRIAEHNDEPYLHAVGLAARANVFYLTGRLRDALAPYRRAEATFRECAGTTWELNGTRTFLLHTARHLGLLAELDTSLEKYLRDARRRGDRYAETTMSRASNQVWLVRGDPERAARELAERSWSPPETGFLHLQHWYEARARAEVHLYRGDGADHELRARLVDVRRSLLMRVQTVRSELTWLEGRLALRRGDRAAVERAARRLVAERVPYARAWAHLLRAGAASRGNPDAAVAALRAALAVASGESLGLCAAVAQQRLGALLGGSEGARLTATARAWMAGQGVRDPAALARIIEPAEMP